MVSIGLLTYNHAVYIKKALDGILMQKVNFKYEVVVGDDASTDGTAEILREYAKKYPELFRLILRKKNIGVTKNSYDLKQYARGKYFACLEGDDYWTDQNKLQIQVDFLERHSEYIACVHRCVFVDENGVPIESQPLNGYYCNDEVFTLKQFERGMLPGQTATLMYRNIFLDQSLDYSILYKASPYIGDKTAILLLLSYGNIYNLKNVMSCYRYIVRAKGRNVSSHYLGKNNRDELMQYLTRLEEYALTELHIPLDMSYKKKQYFVAAVTVWLREPTEENKAVVKRMEKAGGREYRRLRIKVVLYKWCGWKILKKDIRISVG